MGLVGAAYLAVARQPFKRKIFRGARRVCSCLSRTEGSAENSRDTHTKSKNIFLKFYCSKPQLTL